MTYSEKVKTIREKLLLTQEELANELGVNSVTVCRWETGKSEPAMKTKKAIKEFYSQKGIEFKD